MKPKKLKLTITTVKALSTEQLATVPGGGSILSWWKVCASTSIIIKP